MPSRRRSNLSRRSLRSRNRLRIQASQSNDERRRESRRMEEINSRRRAQREDSRQDSVPSTLDDFNRLAYRYIPTVDYSTARSVQIGAMSIQCPFCCALKYKNETKGMCCANGKVKLPPLEEPPEPLKTLLAGQDLESKHFLSNIRKYNSCFQMTSFGADIITDRYMPTFKVKGQIYHKAGSLLPFPNAEPQFLQIYFMGGSDNEVSTRCGICADVRRPIVAQLQELFHQRNELVHLFKTAVENMPSDNYRIVIRADKTPIGEHSRRYNAPTIDEVAILMTGHDYQPRDIVLHRRNNQLTRISETHRSYDALQYPIIHWDGSDGYHFNLKLINPSTNQETNKKCSSMNYYSYRLMIRANEENYLLKCRQLCNQYIVDMYAKIETERLVYLRTHQSTLRSEEYIHLRDAVLNDGNTTNIGRLTILPSSFTGSPRHMHEYSQDTLTYVRYNGRPDLFVTFTCNPDWIEIKQQLLPGQLAADRHDIVARVFKMKLKSLMDFIVKFKVFGTVSCWQYSIEWQKRGLPHAHILIWLSNKIRPEEIDDVICAEIPDRDMDPDLHAVVTTSMIHGPCGPLNRNSPCMMEGKCSKRYPRAMVDQTITGDDGYPQYRRRCPEDGGSTAIIRRGNRETQIDNRWVVPYCPLLSKTFKAHINVEYCHSVKAIKYICKYVSKGSDMAVFDMQKENAVVDEISTYQTGRYISSNEAVWRILSFPIHERFPAVTHLAVHLENGQRVYFRPENVQDVIENPPETTLTAFFKLCQLDSFAKTLLYFEVPSYYTWNAKKRSFERRKRGEPVENHVGIFKDSTLGRIYTIHPNQRDCFYLRLLLINIRGPTSFQDLRIVNGVEYDSFRGACQALGLLEDDGHWDICLRDACHSKSPSKIRELFAIILTTCSPSSPITLWENNKKFMTEDILNRIRGQNPDMDIDYTDDMFNQTLIIIEDLCLKMANVLLTQLAMPSPIRSPDSVFEVELHRELNYDIENLAQYVEDNLPRLTPEQNFVFNRLQQQLTNNGGGIFFLDAPGGTGKTFLINLLLAQIRSRSDIAVAVASSGIAATLLPGGRTAHSAFKLPLNVQSEETPVCKLTRTSGMGRVLQRCKLIVWDECTMAHKKSLEALDRTMQDLRGDDSPFGNALVLLSGDFRQTLPIIPRATPADSIQACLKFSHLWQHVERLQLKTNMRVQLNKEPSAEIFANQLLEIGEGRIPEDPETGRISLPENFCQITTSRTELVRQIFPEIQTNISRHDWLCGRAILAPKNKDVDEINQIVQTEISGETVVYKSVDKVVHDNDAVHYPTEFLNNQNPAGLPPHELQLKKGSPIILLRNINQPKLCNGTRLVIKRMWLYVIEATIITGTFKGEDVLIPRIPIIPSDLPFQFKRLQFPIRLAFAMTINKAQGQSLKLCGIDLNTQCFSHGQLYVACSRVGVPRNLYIAADGQVKNTVYKQVLR